MLIKIHSMSFNNNNLNLNDECPVLPDLIPLESIDLFPSYLDITILYDRITSLSIELNTQSLRIEIEKTKRQKLNMMMKRNRHERILICYYRDCVTISILLPNS